MSTQYLVTWTIDIEADSPEEAATRAMIIQRDPESCALVFGVTEPGQPITYIDLWIEGERRG